MTVVKLQLSVPISCLRVGDNRPPGTESAAKQQQSQCRAAKLLNSSAPATVKQGNSDENVDEPLPRRSFCRIFLTIQRHFFFHPSIFLSNPPVGSQQYQDKDNNDPLRCQLLTQCQKSNTIRALRRPHVRKARQFKPSATEPNCFL